MEVVFANKAFCFTGGLKDLKRTAAEREVRARRGLTQSRINPRLDYLVVGSKGSPGWKHGTYGRKIEEARELRENNGRPTILSEPAFLAALAATPPTNSGEVDGKIAVVTYKFLIAEDGRVDEDGLEGILALMQKDGAHVTLDATPVSIHAELFGGTRQETGGYLVVESRIVRQVPRDFDSQGWASEIDRRFESVSGVDGRSHWFERVEGSADYVRLLAEVPQRLRIEGI